MDTLQAKRLLSNNLGYSTPTLSRPLNKGRGRSGKCSLTYELMSKSEAGMHSNGTKPP